MRKTHFNRVELADCWKISPRTLERWRWMGDGPTYLKIGGRVVYHIEDIEPSRPSSGAPARRRCRRRRGRGDLPTPNYSCWASNLGDGSGWTSTTLPAEVGIVSS